MIETGRTSRCAGDAPTDPTRPNPATRALNQRYSRRHALKLLAGGALGGALALGAATVPVAAAVTARPGLGVGWTHLAGTTTGLLLYRVGDGFAESGTVRDGLFLHQAFPQNFVGDWTHVVGATRSLFFYRRDGFAASGYLDANGVFVQPPGANYTFGTFSGDWTQFPGTRSGRFAWYADGRLSPQALTPTGYLGGPSQAAQVGSGWTHVAGAGAASFVLYQSGTGAAATGRIGTDGNGTLVWIPRTTYQFAPGWTHVVGTYNGGLLFYRRGDGFGATGFLDAFGNFTQTGNPSFGRGWSHVVGAGGRGLLFYNKMTGKGVGGFLTPGGVWKETTTYG